MCDIIWDGVFQEQVFRSPGAEDWEIEDFVSTVQQPLSAAELEWLRDEHGDDHPELWRIPSGPIPESYLSFLRWSNGGEFRNGHRIFQFFATDCETNGVRAMMLAYAVPFRSPGILPFAFNAGGVFYAFDMRFEPRDGEYRIVAAECGYPHKPYELEATFPEACRSSVDFELEWNSEDEITRPMCDDCGEYLICPKCGQRGPVVH